MKINTLSFAGIFIAALASASPGQTDVLRSEIERIIGAKRAAVCVALQGPGAPDTLFLNGERHCAMQSVYKFHLALAVLDLVDRGALSLERRIHVTEADLLPNTWSPLREKTGGRSSELTLRELLEYTVVQSDNNGCDILFRLIGGPASVDTFIRKTGVEEFAIAATEEEMHRSWDVQYGNWTTPRAALRLLTAFQGGRVLSPSSSKVLRDLMEKTTTGPNRLKRLLPRGAIVAHKTGSSGADSTGFSPATNDIGLIVLPDGRPIAIAVFVSDSREKEETNERLIAKIARAAWDYFRGGTRQTVPRIPGRVRP